MTHKIRSFCLIKKKLDKRLHSTLGYQSPNTFEAQAVGRQLGDTPAWPEERSCSEGHYERKFCGTGGKLWRLMAVIIIHPTLFFPCPFWLDDYGFHHLGLRG